MHELAFARKFATSHLAIMWAYFVALDTFVTASGGHSRVPGLHLWSGAAGDFLEAIKILEEFYSDEYKTGQLLTVLFPSSLKQEHFQSILIT